MDVRRVMFGQQEVLTSSVTECQTVLLHLFDDGAFPRLSGTYGKHSEVYTRLADEAVKVNHVQFNTFLHTFKIVSSTFPIGY